MKKIWVAGDQVNASDINSNFLPSDTFFTYGETIAVGDTLYLKISDEKVYKASATSANEAFYNYVGIAMVAGAVNDINPIATLPGSIVTGLSLGAATTAISETAAVTQSNNAGGSIGIIYLNSDTASGFLSGPTQGNISKITASFGATTGTGGGNVTATLYEVTNYDNGTVIFGSSLGSVTITPTASATNTFTFASPIIIKPNTHYVVKFSASAGSAGNYYTIVGSDTSLTKTYFWAGNGATVTSPMQIGTVGKSLTITVYTTLTFNYDIGDNIYMGDTAGTLSFVGGTQKALVGKILSSSSISIETISKNKIIKSYTCIPYLASTSAYLIVPVPKNSMQSELQYSYTNTNPNTMYTTLSFDLGKLETKYIDYADGSNFTSPRFLACTHTWGRGTIDANASVNAGTYSIHTLPVYFYK